jgi:hypothetical protein
MFDTEWYDWVGMVAFLSIVGGGIIYVVIPWIWEWIKPFIHAWTA